MKAGKGKALIAPNEGAHLPALDMVHKVTAELSGGSLTVEEWGLSPGGLIPPHTHTREDECNFVLEGELTCEVGGEFILAPRGSYVMKPRGVPHTLYNAGFKPVRVLEILTPGGFEGYFDEYEQIASDDLDEEERRKARAELGERYGVIWHDGLIPEVEARFGVESGGDPALRTPPEPRHRSGPRFYPRSIRVSQERDPGPQAPATEQKPGRKAGNDMEEEQILDLEKTNAREARLPLLNGIHHLTFITADMDRLISFYERVFEARVTVDLEEEGLRHAFIEVGPHTVLHPFQVPGVEPPGPQPMFQRDRLDHFALGAASEEAFREILRRVVAEGAGDGAVTDMGSLLNLGFTDPDGGQHEVVWIKPGVAVEAGLKRAEWTEWTTAESR